MNFSATAAISWLVETVVFFAMWHTLSLKVTSERNDRGQVTTRALNQSFTLACEKINKRPFPKSSVPIKICIFKRGRA